MSYVNTIMYGATLPTYDSKRDKDKGKGGEKQSVIKADDPANRDMVKKFFDEVD